MTPYRAARIVLTAALCSVAVLLWQAPGRASAACAADLPSDKGRDTLTVQAAKDNTYRVWVRLYGTGAAADSVLLRIDDTYCAITVGNSGGLPANAFSWVNYQDGDPAKLIAVHLTAGRHTVTLAGTEAGTGVDRLLFLDGSCLPQGNGDNCANESDVILLPFSGLHNNGTAAPSHHKWLLWGSLGAAGLLLAAIGTMWYVRRRRNQVSGDYWHA